MMTFFEKSKPSGIDRFGRLCKLYQTHAKRGSDGVNEFSEKTADSFLGQEKVK